MASDTGRRKGRRNPSQEEDADNATESRAGKKSRGRQPRYKREMDLKAKSAPTFQLSCFAPTSMPQAISNTSRPVNPLQDTPHMDTAATGSSPARIKASQEMSIQQFLTQRSSSLLPKPKQAEQGRQLSTKVHHLRHCFRTNDIEWPSTSEGMRCFHCDHAFDWCPLKLPQAYDDRKKVFTRCTGIFCSWSCMKAYNLQQRTALAFQTQSLLFLLVQRVEGRFRKIKCAPSRLALKVYGGHMTIDEYRLHLDFLDCKQPTASSRVEVQLSNMCISQSQISTEFKVSHIGEDSYVGSTEYELSLERANHVHMKNLGTAPRPDPSKSNLDKCMGVQEHGFVNE